MNPTNRLSTKQTFLIDNISTFEVSTFELKLMKPTNRPSTKRPFFVDKIYTFEVSSFDFLS